MDLKFDQICQQFTKKDPNVTLMKAFMAMIYEKSRQKLMIPTTIKEEEVAAIATPRNTQLAPIKGMCDYYHKKGYIRDTCWDLHRRPSGG
jgi:hypothetical protein